MNMTDQLNCDQLIYHKPISIVNQFLDFIMNLRVQEPVRINVDRPRGWTAEVVAEDKVWTITCNENGEVRLIKVGDLLGHTYNGRYIKGAEEDISDFERYYLQENYYDVDRLPITCDLFCNPDEAECQHCPYGKRSIYIE